MTYLVDAYPAAANSNDSSFAHLLKCVRCHGDFDFTEYAHSNISRRIDARMKLVGIADMDTYAEYLQSTPGEAMALCNAIWINFTSFFRDPSVWSYLRTCAIPELLARLPADAPIRIWSAGCASGQEAYSIAMLLSAALGPFNFARRVKIYATDVDRDALSTACLGVYDYRAILDIPIDLREEYFTSTDDTWRVRPGIRHAITFQLQNILSQRPEETFDLIICRNTIIYFQIQAQSRVLNCLRSSLTKEG